MRRTIVLACAAALIPSPHASAQTTCAPELLARLPLVERPATGDSGSTLVLLMTGDGNWAGADEKVSDGLRARGAAVVGVKMRTYLGDAKTPEQVSQDMACVADAYRERWHRQRLMLLGYSRGAVIAPFVVSRWPQPLRERLNMVALVSASTRANFKFHLIDLVKDVDREDDLLVAPEIDKLKGLRVVCIYGTEESHSACPGADPAIVERIARSGGHRLTGGFAEVAEVLSRGLVAPTH